MLQDAPQVCVVDDDPAVLRSLERLLKAAGFAVATFPSPTDFLSRIARDAPGCVLLDLSMPELTGLDLQGALERMGCTQPVIFISGNGDVRSSVHAMKAGALDFLTKPFDEMELLSAVQRALVRDRQMRQSRERLATLTPREREVFDQVVEGRLNKQIAASLGISEKTVKVHRSRVMEKTAARSTAELVRLADSLAARAAQG